MIFALLIAVVSAGTYGVDLANAVSVDTLSCIASMGFSDYFIFRSWQSLGRFDPNAHQNYLNAQAVGFTPSNTDCYFYPCLSCGDIAGQVTSFWSQIEENNMNVNRVWFDVEGYWNDFASNRVFFETMINKQRSIGFVAGIYTSYYMWSIIFDLSYTFSYASEYKLWYAHYDWVENFSDFDAFGGWTYPYMKQYAGEDYTCDFDVDYNYRE